VVSGVVLGDPADHHLGGEPGVLQQAEAGGGRRREDETPRRSYQSSST